MPTRAEHDRIAERDAEFVRFLMGENRCLEWAVTGAFYRAVHLVDRVLAGHGIHPSDHRYRDGCIAKVAELRPIWPHYRDLKTASEGARYYGQEFTLSDLNTTYLPDLAEIERHVSSSPH